MRTSFTGKIQTLEEKPGFYVAVFSSVEEFSTREITVSLNDMRPKALDNLSLSDMDLEIYYTASPNLIAELNIKYANRNAQDPATRITYPGTTPRKKMKI